MAPIGSESQTGGHRSPIGAQHPNSSSGLGPPRHPPPLSPDSSRNHIHHHHRELAEQASSSFRTQRPESSTTATTTTTTTTRHDHGTSETPGEPGPGAVRGEAAPAAATSLVEYPYSIYNHGTWTAEDDKTLLQARSRGQNWAELQRTHFPNKTANACRKRYERLIERRGLHDYSGRRLEMVANEYMNMRRELWSGLADRVGMRWEVVEALCMGAGLRTIQSNARSYTNRARRESRVSQKMRETHAEALSAGPLGFMLPAPPIGSGEFGTAFGGGLPLGDHRNAGTAGIRSIPPPAAAAAAAALPDSSRPASWQSSPASNDTGAQVTTTTSSSTTTTTRNILRREWSTAYTGAAQCCRLRFRTPAGAACSRLVES
ncbi:hypothetical protein VTH82DRAFT_4045 [Thermothelomyces myriococcoides]